MSFKEFDQSTDIQSQLSVVNEVIPVTGSLFSGSSYTKTFINITSGSAVSGGFWQTVYDGSPTSISSSALVDVTFGISTGSLVAARTETFLNNEKKRVYKEMASRLLGDKDSLFQFNSVTYHELFFLNLRRRIYKDEIKKGNTTLTINVCSGAANRSLNLTDTGAGSAYTVGPAGDEADLFSGSTKIGKIYYNAGIVVFPTGVFFPANTTYTDSALYWSGSQAAGNLNARVVSGAIDDLVGGLRNRIENLTFHNQTNIHKTVHFCRKLNTEFNYSSNPTFIDGDGRIIPTSGTDNQTRTYATKIGLYDINNNCLAVASLSEPVKFSPDNEVVVRVSLNY
jgi:hypothetical protein